MLIIPCKSVKQQRHSVHSDSKSKPGVYNVLLLPAALLYLYEVRPPASSSYIYEIRLIN